MRNLKRTLSLVMAMALIVGMMVVSASAVSSDFNDSAEITNTEAVDVMTAIGVFEGTDKGAFNPTGILTREQAAKIVAVMLLGEEDASKLTTNSTTFKDVAANRWSAGYIGYCVQQGILAGTGNGNFDPEGELTGLAFAKMMLVALGYDAKVANYVGNDWAINVAADAVNAGIAPKGIVLANAMTREQAAQMAFQTLTADTVYYTNKGTTVIGSDGMQVIVGASAPVKVANSTTDDYRTVKGDKDEVQQFCEKYFSDLTLNSNNHDDFGRPSDQWKNGTKEIGTYASTADASYSEKVSSKTLYSDLGLDKTTTVDVTEDGKANGTFTIEKGNSDDELGGNGVLVEAFVDNDDNVTLVVINTYVGEISKVTAAKDGDDRYVTVDGKKFETESFEKDDVVLYTMADGEIQTMTLAEVVEGVEVTKTTGDSSFVADGETYKYSAKMSNKGDVKVDSVLDLYLDSYGYVIKVNVSKASSDYAYVVNTGADEGRYDDESSYYAKLLLADGTVVEAEVDEDCLSGSNFSAKETALKNMRGYIVEYSKNSKDIYTIKGVSTSGLAENKKVEINKGESAMTLDTKTVYANSKTVFLVQTGTGSKATYKSYTGYANVPDLKDNSGNFVYYCKSGSTVATMVFISDVSASSDDIVYVLSSKAGTKVKDSDNTYYEYKAVVNGEITTVKMDEELKDSYPSGNVLKTDILLNVIAYADAENEILDASACEEYSKVTTDDTYQLPGVEVKAEAEDGIIDLGGKSYAVSDDVEVYAVTKGKKIETGSLSDVEKGMTVTAIVKNGEIVTIFYGSTTSSGSDKAEISGSGVNTATVVNASDLSSEANGAYVLTKMPEDKKDDIGGEITDNMFFTFRITDKDAQDVALSIKNSKGNLMYKEDAKGVTTGFHYFYVQVIGEGINNSSKGYEMSDKALVDGTYTWTIVNTTTGDELIGGTFTIR